MHANNPGTRRTNRVAQHDRDRSGQAPSRLRYKHLAFGVGLALGSLLVCGTASAASGVAATQSPTGGRVVGGAGAIVQRGASTIVNQQSKLLALDWQSFNVGKDASVLFKQPGKSAIALNRILDQNPSQIFGKIASNGQIFLINTHGIIFGASAQLNVGGLVASTLDLTPDDFLKKHFDLDAHGGHAGVVNHGTIAAASGGSVSLVGGHVENDGVIVADYGHINLDGADKAVLDFDGNGLINVEITGALKQRLDADKQAVANKGTLQATSGTVVLQASAAKNLFTNLVNNSGVIKAGGISTAGGVVRLVGSGGNTVSSGSIDVSGTQGGSVRVVSDKGVTVDGSIKADATQNGDGGNIFVKGDDSADISGTLSARGGSQGGNGGFVETSGDHVHIGDSTRVNTLASFGNAGTWLIDPEDFTIAASGGDMSGATLGGNLSSSDVTIESSAGTHNSSGTGSINVDDAVSWGSATTPHTLTLTAANNININAVMTVNGGGLVLNPATANGTGAGAESAVTTGIVNVMPGVGAVNFTGSGNTLSISGTPYTIISTLGLAGSTTKADLQGINGDLTGHYALGADINAASTSGWNGGDGFTPIGNGTTAFSGAFNGLGHTISGLVINGSAQYAGLFGQVDGGGIVRNVGLLGGSVASSAASAYVGTVVGYNKSGGKLANVHATGDVMASGNAGNVGGLAGENDGSITDAYATGTVTASDHANVGGLVGYNDIGTITNAYASGAVAGGDSAYVGGLVGYGAHNGVGVIENAYATGTVTGGNNAYVGGLVGYNEQGSITDAYATGSVTTGTGGTVGGLAGYNDGTVASSYWDTDTTGMTVGIGSGDTSGVTGGCLGGSCSNGGTTNLSAQATFTGAGWQFGASDSAPWAVVDGKSYPYFHWQFAAGVTPLVVSGTLFTDAGSTAAGAGVAVDGKSGGIEVVSTQTGANGYYYSLLDPGSITSNSVLVYAKNYGSGGNINGAAFVDGYTAALPTLNVFGNALGIQTKATTWATVTGDLANAEGGSATASTALASLPVSGLDDLNVSAAGSLKFDTALSWTTGNLDVTANGDITQTAGLTVSGTSSFTAGAHAITLNQSNDFTGAVSLNNSGANDVTLDNGSNALKLGGSSVGSGTLTVSGVGITQSGAITQATAAGTATFNAGAGVLTLGNTGNDFTGTVSLNNSGVSAVTLDNGNNALDLGASNVGVGSLNVSGKGITQSGAIIQEFSNADPVTFNAGAGVLKLDNPNNSFSGAVSLANSGANAVTLGNGSHPLTLGTVNIGSGALSVSGYLGSLTLAGDITTQGGAVDFTTAVTLTSDFASIDTTGGNAVPAGANISFGSTVDVDSLYSPWPPDVTINAGTNHAVTFGGAVGHAADGELNSLTVTGNSIVLSGGSVTTTNAQTYNGAVVLNNDATLTTTNSAVAFNGTVDSSGSAGKSLTVNSGSGAVTFDDAVGNASGGVLGALKVTSTGATTFDSTVKASSLATSSGITTLGGDVTTSGAQTYNGAVLLNGSGDSVKLTTTGGNVDFTGAVDNKTSGTPETLTIAAGTGDVTFGDAVGGGTNGALAALDITGTGTTTLKGDVTTSSDQTYIGAVLLDDSAGDNSLTLTGDNISFNSTLGNAASLATHQALEVDVGSAGVATFTGAVGSSSDPLGALTLDAGGYALFSSTVDADSLDAGLDTRLYGDVTTHGAQDYEKTLNVFSSALTLTSNNHDITFNDVSNQTSAATLTVDAGSGAVAFNGNVCNGTGCVSPLGLDVTASGGIAEGTNGVIEASASSFDAGTGDITLTSASNDFTGAVTLTGGATKVTTAGALALGKVNVGSLVAKAGGAISQSTVAADAVTVGGTSSFTTGGYTIDLGNTSNNFGDAVSLTNTGLNDVKLDNDAHALTLGNVSVGNGALTVTGAGISQAASTTITQASGAGTTTFNAGTSNALALGNTGNDFTGAVTATGAGVSIKDSNDLDINSIANPINHDLSLIAGGALTIPLTAIDTGTGAITLESGTGGLSAPALTGGAITVSANGGALTTANVSGADIALTGRDGITLSGDVKASGTLGLASTDAAIQQSSGAITTTCATTCTTTVNAGTGASPGTITLNGIGNDFAGAVSLTGGTTSINDINALTLGTLDTGALTAVSHGALDLGTGSVGGALQATSNNGDITQDTATGDSLTVTAAATLDAGTGSITLANSDNDFKGLVYATGTGVSIQDANDLAIASLTDNPGGDVSLIAGGALGGVGAIDAGTGNITLAANGGGLTTAKLVGGDIKLTGKTGITLGDTVNANGGTLTLNSGSTISQNSGAIVTANTLTGTSTGATTLDEANLIGTLGAFAANGFSLTNNQTLTVASGALVDGNTGGTALQVDTGDLKIGGTVGNAGGATALTASHGAITETPSGIVAATTLTGLSSGDTTLGGANQIATLGNFNADDFTLVNHAALNVAGPLITTGNISLTTTGTGNVLSVGQALTGGMITLASAGDLSVQQGIQASTINLAANGNLAIDAMVDSGSGVTTLTQNGGGGSITEGSHGAITAGTLTGTAQGGVILDKDNAITNLGDFAAVNGFKLTNGQKLTVAAGRTVDGGTSTALETTGAGSDLQIEGSVKGSAVDLSSSSDVGEGNHGVVTAGVLTGNVAHAANLTGANAIAGLGDFTANGLALNSAGPLTVVAGATADGGANTVLTVTGATGNLAINGTLKGATTTLNVGGATSEGANGVVSAGTLTGSSVGSTNLTGHNDVANLGDFSANGFALTTDPGLTVIDGATVEGRSGVALTTTGSGNAINIDGTVTGIRVNLTSSGAIAEGANGMVQAGELTGSSAGDTKLTQTEISALDAFKAKNFYLTDAHALSVGGPLATTGNAGAISLTTTGSGNALTINQAVHGGAIKLTSASDLTIANAVTGTDVALASNGNLAINAAVGSGTGTTTLTQAGSGTISGGANGAITAGTLTGSASGATALGSAGQFMANHVGVLGGFSSPSGFSLTNDGTLTLASVGGSAYTVDAGKSKLYLEVHDGDLLQNGSNWLYDGSGTWYATGHIGLANAPIYVTGVDDQNVAFIGRPPAYFYAVDYQGNLLPLTGASSVNVPTSVLSSRSQGINGHTDHYIDISVITANYRGYGVVPPGLLLPPDQWDCAPDQPSPELCPKGN